MSWPRLNSLQHRRPVLKRLFLSRCSTLPALVCARSATLAPWCCTQLARDAWVWFISSPWLRRHQAPARRGEERPAGYLHPTWGRRVPGFWALPTWWSSGHFRHQIWLWRVHIRHKTSSTVPVPLILVDELGWGVSPQTSGLPMSATTSLPTMGVLQVRLPTDDLAGVFASLHLSRRQPVWLCLPVVTVYLSVAPAEPLEQKAPVSTFAPISTVENLMNWGFSLVPPLEESLSAVFGGEWGLARWMAARGIFSLRHFQEGKENGDSIRGCWGVLQHRRHKFKYLCCMVICASLIDKMTCWRVPSAQMDCSGPISVPHSPREMPCLSA